MCWNKSVSAVALGVGLGFTVLGIAWVDDVRFTAISIIFIFLLVMQLAELLAYIAKDNKDDWLMKYATQLALMGNIGQPMVAVMALIPFSTAPCYMKITALLFDVAYAVWACWSVSVQMDSYKVISKNIENHRVEPCRANYPDGMDGWNYYGHQLETQITRLFGAKEEDCHSHIIYPWWRQANPTMYIITLAAAMIFLLRPLSYMIYQFITIFGVLIFTCIFFKHGEVGSQWCLFVVSLCILNPIMWKILVKDKVKFDCETLEVVK